MTIERFLGCAESAVLLSGKPIRLQNEQPACDKRVTCKYIIMSGHDRDSSQRLQLEKTRRTRLERQSSRKSRECRGWLRYKGILLSAAML